MLSAMKARQIEIASGDKTSKYGKVKCEGKLMRVFRVKVINENLCVSHIFNGKSLLSDGADFFFSCISNRTTCSYIENAKSQKSKFHSECLQIPSQHREFPSKMKSALLSSKFQSVVNCLELNYWVSSTVLFWLNCSVCNASTLFLHNF